MNLSVVTTSYNSSSYISLFLEQIVKNIEDELKLTDYEIIIVDDGSGDSSVQTLLNLKEKFSKIKVIELSKNYGQHKALREGMKFATGERIFTIDSDLEESPGLVGTFYQKMTQENVDLIYGYQVKRSRSFFYNIFSIIFYKILNLLSNSQVPPNVTTTHIMKKNVLIEFLKHQEIEVFYQGIIHSMGFVAIGVEVKKKFKKSTEYTFKKKINYFVNGIISFSNFPLYILSFTGLVIVSLSLCYNIYLIIDYSFYSKNFPGWLSLMGLVSLFSGFIIFSVGILGIYISKIFDEIKSRPTIIKNKYL